jgi:lysozyme family protein
MNFDIAFDRVIGHEGRFQNGRSDRGNWTSGIVGQGILKGTKFGISAMSYPNLDIANLTAEQAKGIYYQDWWLEGGMDSFPLSLGYQLFDAAINHGMRAATKMLQRAVGAQDDGQIGPLTKGLIGKMEIGDLMLNFLSERLTFMTNVSTWDDYGKGWARRIAGNLKIAAKDTP